MQVHSTDKQCTNNENYKWLSVSLPKQNTLNIFWKPNIDAALWGPLSYYQSFYPSFSISDTDVCLSLFICLFLINLSLFLDLFHILPKPLFISLWLSCSLCHFLLTWPIYSNGSKCCIIQTFMRMRVWSNDGKIPIKAGHLLWQQIITWRL